MDLWLGIVGAVMARLATTKPTGAPAAELAAGTQAAIPSVRVYVLEDLARPGSSGPRSPVRLRTLGIDVECRASGDTTHEAYTAVSALVAWARGLDGQLLGDAVSEAVETSTVFAFEAQERPAILAIVHVEVQYQQKAGDPARAG